MAMAIETPPTPRTRRFTADEVLRMVDVGILGADERVELIDGELRLVSPPSPEHAWVIDELNRELSLRYGREFTVRVQSPFVGVVDSLPEPDVALRPSQGPWTAERRHPRFDESLLVVEVSITTQRWDRRKTVLYAQAGAPVYWIVDVERRCVIVHDGPQSDGTWRAVREFAPGQMLELPGIDSPIAVAAILPPA